jgi:hypothetical protein
MQLAKSPLHPSTSASVIDFATKPIYVYDLSVFSLGGHSLGGCLAVLAAYETAVNLSVIVDSVVDHLIGTNSRHSMRRFRPILSVQTFGSPRLGNPPLALLLNERLRNYYRIEVDEDLVPMLPR